MCDYNMKQLYIIITLSYTIHYIYYKYTHNSIVLSWYQSCFIKYSVYLKVYINTSHTWLTSNGIVPHLTIFHCCDQLKMIDRWMTILILK